MPLRRTALSIYILLIACCAIGWGQAEDISGDSVISGTSTISGSSAVSGSPASVSFNNMTLTASAINIDLLNSIIKAEGSVSVVTPDGTFTAVRASYNEKTGEGYLDCVNGEIVPFYFFAMCMTVDKDHLKHLQRVSLTTCDRKQKPHYQLLVRDLVIYPDNKEIEARRVSLEIAGFKLFTVPRLHGNLKKGGGGLNLPTYTAGVSQVDGIFVGGAYTQTLNKRDSLNVNARIGTKGLIRGKASLDHKLSMRENNDALLSFIVSNKEDVANRIRVDGEQIDNLLVSRLPAVEGTTRSIPFTFFSHPLSARFGAGLGFYQEDPTNVSSSRVNTWGIVSTPKSPVGPFLLSAEFGMRGCAYPDNQQLYTQIARLTAETPPEKDTYFNVSYQYRNQSGSSPFLFDTNLLPDALYTELECRVTRDNRWRIDAWHTWDFDDQETWDAGITAIYHLDCVSYGLTYDITGNSFELGFRINAFGNFRRGSPSLRFIQ